MSGGASSGSNLQNYLPDAYDRVARRFPALLVALPLLTPIICSFGAQHPVLMAVFGLFTACGVLYLLGSVARDRGKALEVRLVRKWGGMPSTRMLRHRDHTIERPTKARYHAAASKKLEIQMPNAEEEQTDPSGADEIYKSVVSLLIQRTRDRGGLLLKENMSYGFHRNMLAMKGAGITTAVIGLLVGVLLSGLIGFRPFSFQPEGLSDLGLAAGITMFVSASLLILWVSHIKESSVVVVSESYARRLLENLDDL
ncbi:hypothetical protein [Luteimonas fraxinea]|uniref:hypothetical protein n=1 Tax=Luteimonas fraxinea TaxID=2901869 RepID=UPI001E4A9E32|nr:hypothetical protein [Luteimonas fraxinea]MCD9126018.1 hypothetical protein [Luteimonas fraxinea]